MNSRPFCTDTLSPCPTTANPGPCGNPLHVAPCGSRRLAPRPSNLPVATQRRDSHNVLRVTLQHREPRPLVRVTLKRHHNAVVVNARWWRAARVVVRGWLVPSCRSRFFNSSCGKICTFAHFVWLWLCLPCWRRDLAGVGCACLWRWQATQRETTTRRGP
jgi:hypothetical protein